MRKTVFFIFTLAAVLLAEASFNSNNVGYCIYNCIAENKKPARTWGSRNRNEVKLTSRINDNNCAHNICDNDENYPLDLIESKIVDNKDFKSYFGTVTEPHNEDSVVNRFGEEEDVQNMCKTVIHTRYPKIGVNKAGKHTFIVNTERYKQTVTYETCAKKGSKCWCNDCFPNGYSSVCKQQFITIKLVSLLGNDSIGYDSYPIPSNCVCTYVQKIY